MSAWNEIRLPGVARPPDGTTHRFSLPRGNQPVKIARAAFEGKTDIVRTSLLSFSLHTPTSSWMFPDIIRGDFGFPVIFLKNKCGTLYKFNRGNLKDFFDITDPNTPQQIVIPVSAFVHHTTAKSGVSDDGNFFDHEVIGIYFDFLCHPDHEIDICLDQIEARNAPLTTPIDARDLIVFERVNQAKQLPLYSTETGRLSFGLSLSNTGMALGYSGGNLDLVISDGKAECDSLKVSLGLNTTYVQLSLPRPGPFTMRATLSHPSGQIVSTSWPVCRLVTRQPDPKSTCLGISDEFEYDRIGALGGSWDRLVVSIQGVVQDPEYQFRFAHGSNALQANACRPGRFRTFASAGMPKWLSRADNPSDYNRYAPRDWGLFRELVIWLTLKLKESGATHYEVWNEASVHTSWNEDAATLVKLHKVSHEAVKSVAPDIQVLGGCTHSWSFEYLNQFFKEGGADYCDGIAVHGYTYQPHDYLSQFDRLERMIDRFAPARPDFLAHITEIGFRYPAFSLDAQAKYLSLYTLEAASRSRVGAVLWFRYTNPRPELLSGYRQNSSTGYALVGNNNTYCRPALSAYRFMERILKCFDRVQAVGTGEKRFYQLWMNGEVKGAAGYQTERPMLGWSVFDHYGAMSTGPRPELSFEISPDLLHRFT